MAVNEQTPRFGRVAAERKDRRDVRPLRQQKTGTWLDRIVKTQRGAKVGIERLERRRVRPVGVKDRENMGDAPALVAVEFVKSANDGVGEGGWLHGGNP